jgi:hypothetical protein
MSGILSQAVTGARTPTRVISPRKRAALVRIGQLLVKRLLIGFIEFYQGARG